MARKDYRVNGEAIRRARIFAGFSGKQFAAHLGTSAPHLSQIENGRRSTSPEMLKRIADATGKTVEDFVIFEKALAA